VEVLAQWLLTHQGVELAGHLGVPARRQIHVDRALRRTQPQLVETPDLGGGERLVGDVRERLASPQAQRLPGTAGVEQLLEARRVHRTVAELQFVAPAARHDPGPVALEHPPEVRDVELHHLLRARRPLVAPQAFGEAVSRDRPPDLQRKHREHRPLLARPQLEGLIADACLDRP
jgi:hypothetical protein